MEVTRTFDLLDRYANLFSHKTDVFAAKVNQKWEKYNVSDYISNANFLSYGLLALGFKPGDKIATISNNRPEWNFVDMGLAQAGFLHVPVFTTLNSIGYKEILEHAGVTAVFVSDKRLYDIIIQLVPENVYTFEKVEGAKHWTEVRDLGREKSSLYKEQVVKIKGNTKPTDPVTLIYTSGTTGNPKGVLLSHQNLMTNAIAASKVFMLKPDQRYLSILPICHVGERLGSYQTQYSGCSIYYAEHVATIANDLKDVQPHGFGAVPRILEKVYDKIINRGRKLTGIKKKLFFWAVDLGLQYKLDGANGLWYELKLKLANKLIFSKWREAIGGNVVSVGIGGAALQPRLEKVFWAAGIKLLNMYGSTETATIITLNRQQLPDLRFGSVGATVEGVEVKIADDGEILCKGPNVMLGYYKNEKGTNEVIDSEGWFHTGDIGVLEDGKFLHITDRKKEIFKLSNSIYISPQAIESQFKESVYIDQIMVIGDGEKFTSALIAPNFEELTVWCSKNNIQTTKKQSIVEHPKVLQLFNNIAIEYNKSLSKEEQVKRFRIVQDEWTPDTGELSPTLKLKRRILNEKYAGLIREIFGKDDMN